MNIPRNIQVAMKLEDMAQLLEQQGANPFRISAYRQAARSVEGLATSLDEILHKDGIKGLTTLPGIGTGIANAITEILNTGRWGRLERLRGELDPVQVFQTVPGIGGGLAQRIHDALHIDTLEALEAAAYDGRLETVPGIGPRRSAALRASLAIMLRRSTGTPPLQPMAMPALGLVLEVDRIYRQRAAQGALPLIAPRRFNPQGEAWLPVLHLNRQDWHFTAMYSNTARAHQLGRTQDWVVVYFYDDHRREGQHTLVTETRGPLLGQRVVRGRESECRDYYLSHASQPDRRRDPVES